MNKLQQLNDKVLGTKMRGCIHSRDSQIALLIPTKLNINSIYRIGVLLRNRDFNSSLNYRNWYRQQGVVGNVVFNDVVFTAT